MPLKPSDALEAIRSRRSIRQYTEEPVSEEALEAVLDAALRAPTANAKRPWWIVVVQGSELTVGCSVRRVRVVATRASSPRL